MTGSDSRQMLSNIFLGKVVAPRPAMKIETTASLNENRNANNAATIMPGRSTGKVTQKKVRMGPAASASYINLTAGRKGRLSIFVDSIQAHAARFDRVAPFFDLARDELFKIIRGPSIGSDDGQAEHFQPRLHRRAVDRRDGCVVELCDN
jgi:hypothetical protein